MPSRLVSLLGCLHRLRDTATDAGDRDADLLDRFLRIRDQQAFDTLVHRHGPLVMSVCRRTLCDEQSAEDAFQATFLILARKAKSLSRPEALAGWLHGVAWRVANKARHTRARRRFQVLPEDTESRVPSDPLAEVSARELLAIVDEEIASLPERLRLPIVLCCLEGCSQEEAAQRLGWPSGSVKGRLERARMRLHARLTRRGLTLSAGLIAVEVSRGAARTVSPLLVSATTDAVGRFCCQSLPAVAMPGHAMKLANAVLREHLVGKVVRSVVIATLVVAIGMGAAVWLPSMAAPQAPQAEEAKKTIDSGTGQVVAAGVPAAPVSKTTVIGRVVDTNGKPVSGVKVYLRERRESRTSGTWKPSESRDIAGVAANADGEFAFRDVSLLPPKFGDNPYPLDVIFHAPGYALTWRRLQSPLQGKMEIVLTPEARLKGRLLEASGTPAANVAVELAEIAALDQPFWPQFDERYLDLRWSNVPLTAHSNADGFIELRGLPRDVRVALRVNDPRYLRDEFFVATTDRPQPPLTVIAKTHSSPGSPKGPFPVHVGEFSLRLNRGFRVRVQVVYDDTGEPALGVRWTAPPHWSPPNRDVDAHGRFELDQVPSGKLRRPVFTPDESSYLSRELVLDLEGDPRTIEHTLRLERGVIVEGRVVEEGSGAAIQGANVYSLKQMTESRSFGWSTKTNVQGRFRLAVPAGEAIVVVSSVPAGYFLPRATGNLKDSDPRFLRKFEASSATPPLPLHFVVERGIEIVGTVRDLAGVTVALTKVEEPLAMNADFQMKWTSKSGGAFEMSGLTPEKKYRFAFTSGPRQLAVVVELVTPQRGSPPVSLHLKLEPMGSLRGRVIDQADKPLANATVRLWRELEDNDGRRGSTDVREAISTDANGEFLWKELLPGVAYSVRVTADGYQQKGSETWKTEAGQEHTLTTIRLSRMRTTSGPTRP